MSWKMLLEPFDPSKHNPKDVGLGGPSTEYLMTFEAPDGGYWNVPSIWWGPNGNAYYFPEGKSDDVWNMAKEWEDKTGERFPRYDTMEGAEMAAARRSEEGGASERRLTQEEGQQ